MKPIRLAGPARPATVPRSPEAPRAARDALRPAWLFGIAAGIIALGLTWAAHAHGRPITSALVAVFGVMAVGALLGVRAALFAGIAASLTFNLVFTDPAGTFTYSTADDLVPMIALTLSAIGSGVIAGRLRDRAIAAESARSSVAELLRFSEDLQSAVTLFQVETVAHAYLGSESAEVQLFVEADGRLQPAGLSSRVSNAAQDCWDSGLPRLGSADGTGFLLRSGEARVGVLVVENSAEAGRDPDLFLPLIVLAIERCRLAEQLARAELVRRSEQFKTALLSSVSHDLRTPLAAISASASSLVELGDGLDPAIRSDLLHTIGEQCGRLDRFTRNLLNLGRIEAGLDLAAMPMIDGVEVLGGALARIRRLNSDHAIQRDFTVAAAPVRADESLLEQLFSNVLENAVTHTPSGTSVRVTAGVSAGWLTVAVEDDGPGIPAGEQERVFDRFHQIRVDRQRSSGSGLGLSIAKGFTELFGGAIRATGAAEPLRGARIEIRLPLAAPVS